MSTASAMILLIIGGVVTLIQTIDIWAPAQPKENIWVTLANRTGQEAICLSLSSAGNPFSTCLVGLPLDNLPCPTGTVPLCQANESRSYADQWDLVVPHFSRAAQEPEELEILGTVRADFCVRFNWTSVHRRYRTGQSLSVNANPILKVYQNASMWCNYTSPNISKSSNMPIRLPQGIFLICGDRAWPGVPSKLEGGPCTLGRLTLLSPNTSMIIQQYKKHKRTKRMIHGFQHAFQPDCDDQAQFWSRGERILGSLVPGVGTAQALTTLNKIGCWLAKQTNATSIAISGLLTDVNSIRHATLQNRAAIDFLLLAHGHGCQDFEGMCCMNLSDHSVSIHAQLTKLATLTSHLQEDTGFGLNDWLRSLGLGPWLTSFLQHLIIIGIVLFAFILIVPCFCACLRQALNRMIANSTATALLAYKENGGSVDSLSEQWLRDKGHMG
ncbi:uncharacterized protein LOC117001738 [Catharus ustulatus]|uniref:uncharacterized protein LOC117001738 n=1 Tax=Catharus ustulatus TaxID=91951 RepID=UPI001407DFFA|nr:uncharacterized protein LOC117001738 [Catharus ustulatus]XP_032926107.1 uncharacterized protein LOC117001738 [Catharus ustulatus]